MPLSVSLWNDLSDPVFDGVGLAGFKSRANAFLLAWSALSFWLLLFYLLPSIGWLCGAGVFGLIECSHSLPALHSWLQIIIIIISCIIPSFCWMAFLCSIRIYFPCCIQTGRICILICSFILGVLADILTLSLSSNYSRIMVALLASVWIIVALRTLYWRTCGSIPMGTKSRISF